MVLDFFLGNKLFVMAAYRSRAFDFSDEGTMSSFLPLELIAMSSCLLDETWRGNVKNIWRGL